MSPLYISFATVIQINQKKIPVTMTRIIIYLYSFVFRIGVFYLRLVLVLISGVSLSKSIAV